MKNIIITTLLSGLLATALIAGEGKTCSAEASLKKAEAKMEAKACCPSEAKAAKVVKAEAEGKACCPSKDKAAVASKSAEGKKEGKACTSCAKG